MTLAPAFEEPFVVYTAVLIEVANGHNNPPIIDLMFRPTVGCASGDGRARVNEINPVSNNLMDRASEPSQSWLDVVAQRFTPRPSTADPHVGNKQTDPLIQIAPVDRHGIPNRELANGKSALDSEQSVLNGWSHWTVLIGSKSSRSGARSVQMVLTLRTTISSPIPAIEAQRNTVSTGAP